MTMPDFGPHVSSLDGDQVPADGRLDLSPPLGRIAQVESRSIDYVPLSERHGKVWHLFPVWFTGGAQLATVATGVIGVSLGANLLWSMIAIVAGCAFGTFFMAFHSTQGPQLGLPQMIQSRPQFGYMGALVVWVVALVSYVGYNVFNQVLAGQAMEDIAHVPPIVSYVVFTALALLLAIAGYDWIHKAQRWLSFPLVAGLLVASVGALIMVRLPASQFDLANFQVTPFLAQFIAAAAYQLSWAIYVSDYSRYLPPTVPIRSTFWSTYTGTLLGGAWVMLLGAVAAVLNMQLDVVPALRALGDHVFPGFGTLLLLATIPGLITISSLNFYGGSLTLLSVKDSIKKLCPTTAARITALVIIAAICFVLTLTATNNFLSNFSSFLGLLFYLLTPWTAINLIDFYVVRKTHYSIREIFNPRGIYGRWSWRGLLAYGAGFACMIPFFSTSWFTGPVAHALNGMDLSVFIGLPVAAGVYLIACISLDTTKEAQEALAADALMLAEGELDDL
ncbi:purine-cytosine permease family protein [Arthrobacter sp. A5]|uniref:purine-cytosine permease family protein n=1 Tax=Arthrobacter sp. A5 TaxID=576926 RepID=UPI003DA9F4D6